MDQLLNFLQILVVPVFGLLIYLMKAIWDGAMKAVAEVRKEHDALRDNVQAFQVKVASEYVHVDRLKDLETRILSAISRLEDKIDKRQESGHA